MLRMRLVYMGYDFKSTPISMFNLAVGLPFPEYYSAS